MRKRLITSVVLLALMLGCTSCDETMLGVGAGVAGASTFESWRDNLENQKAELQEQYDAAFAALEQAPNAEAIEAAKSELAVIQNQQTANAAALLTVESVLKYPTEGGTDDRKDFWASVLIGGGVLAMRELSRRKLDRKYGSFKVAQKKLADTHPEAYAANYAEVGLQQVARGLYG